MNQGSALRNTSRNNYKPKSGLSFRDSLIRKFFVSKKGVAPKECYTFFDLECILKHDSLIFSEIVHTVSLLTQVKDKPGFVCSHIFGYTDPKL